MGQQATREELAELLLDEAGQTVFVAAVGDFLEEGFEVLTNDGVEDGLVRVAGLIRAVGVGHALEYRVRGAAPMPRDGYTAPVLGRASNGLGPTGGR